MPITSMRSHLDADCPYADYPEVRRGDALVRVNDLVDQLVDQVWAHERGQAHQNADI